MTRRAPALIVFLASAVLVPASARAQSVTGEVDVTAGHSSEGPSVLGTQLRLFGPVGSEWRVWLEASWAGRSPKDGPSDAFGAAYPYDGHLRPIEMYAERTFAGAGRLATVRTGRYRSPFGISGRSDYAYGGFTRAPLVRYGSNWALSNTFFDTGVDVLVGRPSLSVESSVGMSDDEGEDRRPNALDTAVRVQGYAHALIVGMSYIHSRPSMAGPFIKGAMRFGGIDARWMKGGVLMRGEWLTGRPFNSVSTRGGYLDAIVHRTGMGPVTAVARIERLDYDAGPYSAYYRRVTAGGRYQATRSIGAEFNVLHQPHGLGAGTRSTAVDASVTYTVRFRRP